MILSSFCKHDVVDLFDKSPEALRDIPYTEAKSVVSPFKLRNRAHF